MANLLELFDNVVEFQNYNGVPLAAGKLYVFALGRTRLMDTWSDVDGESLNPNPIILDDLGQCHCYVSDSFDYTIVVCDQFDNEIFSVDKYLLSKGEHSHADVAVAPSEHIGVSSYHVGEVTVYVPYLTGEVGKTYEGIDPIVVNNTLNRISANHIPLGVQDPLYFVEDSETACIIGCSAQTEIPAELSGKWDEASDAVIANSAQWAEGTEYEAGSYVDIDGHTISVTGLQPEGDYAYNSALSSKLDVTALPQDLVHSGELTAYYPASNPSGFITGVDLSNYATNEDLQTVSADITAMIPTALTGDYLTKESADTLYQPIGDYLSSTDSANFLLTSDSGNFYPMEGNPSGFLTAHQSLQGYATENWVTSQGYLTAVDIPESAVWNATTQTVSANSAQWAGGTANPQIPVTGINGIKISESGDQVVFEVSGDYYPGNNPSGFITGVDLSNYATTAQVSEKLDTTAFSDVSGTFLTAHQSLADYQTTAGMTAYLTTGDSAEFMTTAERSDYIPTGVSSEFYTTANTANYISEVPDTYLQNTDLSTTDGKVTAISGIPLSAGGDVPEGVMVESGLEYNAVNEISGYAGSAIAQYGAEKQWLQHDDTIVHVSNSAQYAFGCNISALQRLMGIDETVLWSGNLANTGNVVLSEAATGFNKIRFYVSDMENRGGTNLMDFAPDSIINIGYTAPYPNTTQSFMLRYSTLSSTDYITYNCYKNGRVVLGADAGFITGSGPVITKVIGIGRKS